MVFNLLRGLDVYVAIGLNLARVIDRVTRRMHLHITHGGQRSFAVVDAGRLCIQGRVGEQRSAAVVDVSTCSEFQGAIRHIRGGAVACLHTASHVADALAAGDVQFFEGGDVTGVVAEASGLDLRAAVAGDQALIALHCISNLNAQLA